MPILHLQTNTVHDSEGTLPDGCAKTLMKTTRLARPASLMLQLTPDGHCAYLR